MDATTTYDCKIAGCEKEARTNRGIHAYLCDEHKGSTNAPPPGSAGNGSAEALKNVMKLARIADRKRERAGRLTSRALAAKAEADDAAAEYRAAARELLQEDD